MPKYGNIVIAFVEGNVQNRFIIIGTALKEFIDKEAPIIEEVNLAIKLISEKKLSEVGGREIELSVRRDVATAKNSLSIYNRIFGRIDHHLGMMSSNYTLPHFLEESGIAQNEIVYVQAEIASYWDQTYGPLLHNFSTLKEKLRTLASILEKEVKMLESMPNVSYFAGFDNSRELRQLFDLERATFWDIVNDSKNLTKEMKKVDRLYKIQCQRTKEIIKSILKIQQRQMKKDWSQAETTLRKSLLVLSYLAGTINIYLNLEQTLIKKSTHSLFDFLRKRRAHLVNVEKRAIDSVDDLTASSLEELLKAL